MVGLYLDPPGGAVVLSIDEKTQVQALDRTQPLLPVDFGRDGEAHPRLRTPRHDKPVRRVEHRNREGSPRSATRSRTGEDFLRFLSKAVRPHRGKEIHVILDNLSTHDTPRGAGLAGTQSRT